MQSQFERTISPRRSGWLLMMVYFASISCGASYTFKEQW